MRKLFTSEAVTEGHPDKVCDKISDAILDAVLSQDKDARVACEVCVTTGMILIMGEITTNASVNYSRIARDTVRGIGYDSAEAGFDADMCNVLITLDRQSPDISLGTNDDVGGAGNSGMVFGYACKETEDFMPLPITLANRLAYNLTLARKGGFIDYILPDGKTQVTVEYNEDDEPTRIDSIVVSTQHKDGVSYEELRQDILDFVVNPVLAELEEENPYIRTDEFDLYINPTGRFVKGGPAADSGMTGRKIICDTYGGYAAHGGGSFSGKDPTKTDRSAAYAARHIAKNIVAAGVADKCQVQLAYVIGIPEPISVRVDTFETGLWPDERICEAVKKVYDLTPRGIIDRFDLRRPIYKRTAAYGHFGSVVEDDRSWERLDSAEDIEAALSRP